MDSTSSNSSLIVCSEFDTFDSWPTSACEFATFSSLSVAGFEFTTFNSSLTPWSEFATPKSSSITLSFVTDTVESSFMLASFVMSCSALTNEVENIIKNSIKVKSIYRFERINLLPLKQFNFCLTFTMKTSSKK